MPRPQAAAPVEPVVHAAGLTLAMLASIRTLMAGLIDYAGLFPPASLSMAKAVEQYASHLRTEEAWMLGTFICPAARLREFSEAASVLLPGTHGTSGYREMVDAEPWRLSALIGDDPRQDLETIHDFNDHHGVEDHGLASVVAVEIKANKADDIDQALDALPEHLYPYFELPLDRDCRGLIAALAGEQAAAKARCGGVTPNLIPPVSQVAAFITTCVQGGVPFKATAGLHHPVRREYPLTYAPDAPRGVMHGFLNVFVGAALARANLVDQATLEQILSDTDPTSFQFDESGVAWKNRALDLTRLAQARESFALSYGSCSFDEPVEDLRTLGLL